MSNPLHILKTLDRRLTVPAELTIFGRAALALGFAEAPNYFHNTKDVDGILPMTWLEPPDAHMDFWRAVQETNTELEHEGLYLTHLFREVDVILLPDWIERRVVLDLGLTKLTIYRPECVDLILSKMARGDEDDLQDIEFLLKQESLSLKQLELAIINARIPDVPEIQELFQRTRPKVLSLAKGII